MANLHHPTDEVLSPIEASAKAIKDNPIQFAACIAVFIAVLIGTQLFNLNSRLTSEVQASAYARALDIEDPQGKVDALSAITSGKTRYAAEALFMKGLTAIETEEYDTAKSTLSRLREEHPDFEFTPAGVEGIGTIHEIQGEFTEAIAVYTDIQATWPDSFAALRQPFNIGRCYEGSDNPEEAITAYQNQIQAFPNSNVAAHAQQRLDLIYASNPEMDAEPELDVSIDVEPDG